MHSDLLSSLQVRDCHLIPLDHGLRRDVHVSQQKLLLLDDGLRWEEHWSEVRSTRFLCESWWIVMLWASMQDYFVVVVKLLIYRCIATDFTVHGARKLLTKLPILILSTLCTWKIAAEVLDAHNTNYHHDRCYVYIIVLHCCTLVMLSHLFHHFQKLQAR